MVGIPIARAVVRGRGAQMGLIFGDALGVGRRAWAESSLTNRWRRIPIARRCASLTGHGSMVAEMSMKEMLQFERSIPNPGRIEWVIGSGDDGWSGILGNRACI